MIVEGGTTYTVCSFEWRNDSHMSLQDSELPGAGSRQFAWRQPRSRKKGEAVTKQVVIRMDDQACLYAKRPLIDPAQVVNADYTAQAPHNQRTVYVVSIHDGSDIGRFTNDAGLLPRLCLLVELSNKVAKGVA